MARLRTPEPARDDLIQVPDELCDFQHPVWKSVDLTERWYLEHLGAVPTIGEFWQRRRSSAETSWALHHGIVKPGDPNTLDHGRLRLMGIGRIPALERAAIAHRPQSPGRHTHS